MGLYRSPSSSFFRSAVLAVSVAATAVALPPTGTAVASEEAPVPAVQVPAAQVPPGARADHDGPRDIRSIAKALRRPSYTPSSHTATDQGRHPRLEQAASQLEAKYLSSGAVASLGGADLADLACVLRQAGGPEARQTLATLWMQRLEKGDLTHTAGEFLELARLLKETQGSKEAADAAAQQIERQVLVASPERSVADLLDVLEAGRLLSASSLEQLAWGQLEPAVFLQTPAALQMKPAEIERLANVYEARDARDRNKLASFLVGPYLGDPQRRSSVYAPGWVVLSQVVADLGQAEDRQAMLELTASSLQSGQLKSRVLRPQVMTTFLSIGQRLGAGSQLTDRLVAAWLQVGSEWEQIEPSMRQAVVDALRSGDLPSLLQQYPPEPGLSAAQYEVLFAAARRMGRTAGTLQPWASGAFATLTMESEPRRIGAVVRTMSTARVTLDAAGAERLVQIVAAQDQGSTQLADEVYESVARVLAGHRAVLEAKLTDERGRVNLAVAKALAWHHRHDESIRSFAGQLGGRVGEAQGDDLARWELAQAYAVSLTRQRGVRRTDGDEHVKRALGAAESDEMRLACLEELSAAGMSAGSVQYPLQVIASLRGQFGPQQQERLAVLEHQLQAKAGENN